MGLEIRQLSPADIGVAATILDAAYGVGEDRRVQLDRYLSLQPNGWLLAVQNGRPAGMVGAVCYERFAYIGMMAVDPAFQRQGIGLALMQRLLAWLDGSGCSTALLDATDAGRQLYRRLGFVDVAPALWLQAASHTPGAWPGGRVRSFEVADLPAVVAFDAPIFGAPRAAVLIAFLTAYAGRSWVLPADDGSLAGYIVAQERSIGPWAARSVTAAETLLHAALSVPFSAPPRVIVPPTNSLAPDLLARYGMQRFRVVQHMRRGDLAESRPAAELYAQASFVVG